MTTFQRLIFELDGLTAGDYLAYVRDPDPPGLGGALHSIAIHAEPLSGAFEVVLAWNGTAPAPAEAALLAGLPLTPEVTGVHRGRLEAIAA